MLPPSAGRKMCKVYGDGALYAEIPLNPGRVRRSLDSRNFKLYLANRSAACGIIPVTLYHTPGSAYPKKSISMRYIQIYTCKGAVISHALLYAVLYVLRLMPNTMPYYTPYYTPRDILISDSTPLFRVKRSKDCG